MVTVRPGRDPDDLPEDYPIDVPKFTEPRFPRFAFGVSFVLGVLLALVCIPVASLVFLPVWILENFASDIGIENGGWSTYWYIVAARILVLPVYPFGYFFTDGRMMRNHIFPSDEYLEEIKR